MNALSQKCIKPQLKCSLNVLPRNSVRWLQTQSTQFIEGDIVILRDVVTGKDAKQWLSEPLRPGRRLCTHKGNIDYDQIIGKSARSKVATSAGKQLRLVAPTLEDYTRLTNRLVTPIYAQAASVIVSLLDIHISRPEDEEAKRSPQVEILESGTGHGSLTLQLARAIHGANPPPVRLTSYINASPGEGVEAYADIEEKLKARASKRNAVVHTVEIKRQYSTLAEQFVRNFRHGMYYGDVDFNVSCVSEWIETQFRERGSDVAFLDHVLLDMPNAADHLALASKALKTDGCLMVFFPSITQVVECVMTAKKKKLDLFLENVIELDNRTVGGRYWDVKFANIRAKQNLHENVQTTEGGEVAGKSDSEAEKKLEMICRPEFGYDRVGTCFVGLFKRKSMKDQEID